MIDKWDLRYLGLARYAATWSKDPSTKVGAAVVCPRRRQIIPGYNGFPAGVDDDPALYENREEKYKRVVHAELNAILNAGQSLVGWTLYCAPLFPCNECAKAIIQVGIRRVVSASEAPDRWREANRISYEMFDQSGVVVEIA